MDETMRLRRGVAADAPAIRALTREAYAKWVAIIGREPKSMIADYAKALRDHRFDLLTLDGTLAALIETVARADHLLVENVAVAPSFQRRGFGRMLIANAEWLAASSGLGEVRLYANKLFAENLRLYGRLGYEVDREEAFGDRVVVHMSKRVGP